MKRMLRFIPLNYCLIPQDMRSIYDYADEFERFL